MRALSKPEYNTKSVYEACINSISTSNLLNRLNATLTSLVEAANDYDLKAQTASLFLIQANTCENNNIVLGSVTKQELKDLYNQHMIGKKKPARAIYDELLGAAPGGKCPLCGFGHASTLDHYLPKSKFPFFSVLPLNLVPACKDCNKGKSTNLAISAEQQTIHPYYDHQGFISEQWLFAEVEETYPTSIRFHVALPENWADISKQRARAHFNDFDLSRRFSIEAADELSSINPLLSNLFAGTSKNAIQEFLKANATVEFENHKNSWKTAMYQALGSSDWYCEGGFILK